MSEVALGSAGAKVLDEVSGPSWSVYPEYKDSGAEWPKLAPSHWAVKRLRFSVKTNPTKSEVKVFDPLTEISFVPMEAVGEYGGLNIEGQKLLEDVAAGYTYFRNGDVLVAKITPCFENGKGALAANLFNGIGFGTTELHVVRPAKDQLDARFLFYLSISHSFRKFGEAEMYGAGGQKRIPEDFIKDFRAFLPPLPEQSAIVSFLDRETARIDDLIVKKQRLIELLQEKRTALISQAVTKGLDPGVAMKESGVEWLGEVPAHWEVKRIKNLLLAKAGAIKTGPFGSQLLSSEMYGGDVKVYNQRTVIDNDFQFGENYISCEKFEDLKGFQVFPGDLLVTTRGTIGQCSIMPNGAEVGILHPCLMRLQINPIHAIPEYISLLIQDSRLVRDQLRFMSNATTIDVIYSESLKSVCLPMPPLDEQRRILDFLEANLRHIEDLCSYTSKSIQALQEYRAALISAAVTGKIDVR